MNRTDSAVFWESENQTESQKSILQTPTVYPLRQHWKWKDGK